MFYFKIILHMIFQKNLNFRGIFISCPNIFCPRPNESKAGPWDILKNLRYDTTVQHNNNNNKIH